MRLPHPLAVAFAAVLAGDPLDARARWVLGLFILRALRAGVRP